MDYLKAAPSIVDVDAIDRQWESVKSRYLIQQRKMPSPIWAERGYDHDGFEAWQQLSCDVPAKAIYGPMSIYVHVPFCDRMCGFCDCYSLPIGKNKRKKEEKYGRALLSEMEAWARIHSLNHRPITTVHFGGGTPNYLSSSVFENIIEWFRSLYNISTETEWALESTSSLLTDEHLAKLREWGFTRLHVGVQTLEEPIRGFIGRREKAKVVVERLARANDMDFITSVDIIYGLPGQTLEGLVSTLERLIDIGVHGFSLYRLNVSKRNRRFLELCKDFKQDPVYDYVLFQVSEQVLVRSGYQKNHFAHFAQPEDRNLYFTHAQREEDLLALGATADGVFDYYHYRHPEYSKYVNGIESGAAFLAGGVWEPTPDRKTGRAKTALMGGSISLGVLKKIGAENLLDDWLKCELIRKCSNTEGFVLTANGSWFVNNMISKLINPNENQGAT
jgi:coproporphyrinogen III oxidase-like Fe-S oxidoreductase